MGKYQHGPVHKRPKRWKAGPDNRKKHEARIAANREILAACKAELEAARGKSEG